MTLPFFTVFAIYELLPLSWCLLTNGHSRFSFFVKPKNGVCPLLDYLMMTKTCSYAEIQHFWRSTDKMRIYLEWAQSCISLPNKYRKARITIRRKIRFSDGLIGREEDQAKWRYGNQNHSDIHKQTVNLLRSSGCGIADGGGSRRSPVLSLTSWKIQCCAKRAMDGGHQNFNLIFHTLKPPDAHLQKEKRMTTIMSSSSFDEKLLLLREPFARSSAFWRWCLWSLCCNR